MKSRKPKNAGCPAWILEGVRRIRDAAVQTQQPKQEKNK
jgi:hypothetical protein